MKVLGYILWSIASLMAIAWISYNYYQYEFYEWPWESDDAVEESVPLDISMASATVYRIDHFNTGPLGDVVVGLVGPEKEHQWHYWSTGELEPGFADADCFHNATNLFISLDGQTPQLVFDEATLILGYDVYEAGSVTALGVFYTENFELFEYESGCRSPTLLRFFDMTDLSTLIDPVDLPMTDSISVKQMGDEIVFTTTQFPQIHIFNLAGKTHRVIDGEALWEQVRSEQQ